MKLAVIVPVYKVEPYLRQCIESILSQSYQDLKVILVDDGSPDSCGAICDEYAAQDSRVLALHKPNGGQSSARNLALQYVGDCQLITFLDSDDWLEPDIYQHGVTYLVEHPEVDIINYGYRSITEEKTFSLCSSEEHLTREEALIRYVSTTSVVINPVVWSRIYRCEVIQELRFIEGHKWEDVVYVLDALYNCTGEYHVLPLIGVNYRSKRPGATTSELFPDNLSLFEDLAASPLNHPGDAYYLALANTMAANTLWHHVKYLLTFGRSVAMRELKPYLSAIDAIKSRPYLGIVTSRSKTRKVNFFLAHPQLYCLGRSLFRSLSVRKKS